MTALGKLFRATAFQLSLAILALSAVGAGARARRCRLAGASAVVDDEMAQTIEAEAKGLAEQYAQGGVRQPRRGHRGALARSPAPRSIC